MERDAKVTKNVSLINLMLLTCTEKNILEHLFEEYKIFFLK